MIRFHDQLSPAVRPGTWALHEPNLVDVGREFPPLRLSRALGIEIGPRLDPEGHRPSEKELAEPGEPVAVHLVA